MLAHSKADDNLVILDPRGSRQAFEDEVRYRLHIDAQAFFEQWRDGKLNRQDPDVEFLVCLAEIACTPSEGA